MKKWVYYNENDKSIVLWIKELIKRGLVADGEVDDRDIQDVCPEDLRGFTRCHFFAGILGWEYALQEARWPEDRPVWTGSCPCQSFSTAGKRKGFDDERHLWPSFFWLISQHQPDAVFGEQVASKDALAWWDLVRTDLEGAGYACGVCDTCAAGFGAPHIRQRLYWVAQSVQRREYQCAGSDSDEESQIQTRGATNRWDESVVANSAVDRVADTAETRCERREISGQPIQDACQNSNGHIGLEYTQCSGLQGQPEPDRSPQGRQEQAGCFVNTGDVAGGLGDAQKSENLRIPRNSEKTRTATTNTLPVGSWNAGAVCPTNPTNGFWANPDWLWCRDKKWRPIKSGLVPLADRLPEGMVRGRDCRAIRQRLQGYGNAIVIPQAVEFIKAAMELL